jgi:hypothetical protein
MTRRETVASVSLAVMAWAAPCLAQHEDHAEPAPSPSVAPRPTLFESDMSRMTGMTAHDPMAGMAMPGWSFMVMGVAAPVQRQGGRPATRRSSSNLNMLMLQRDLAGGRLTFMMMNSARARLS